MIAYTEGTCRFQVRAAALVRHAGHLLVHQAEGEDFWTLPGGRVEVGETAEATVVRELEEELGVAVVPRGLRFVAEHFFDYDGHRYHELGLYVNAALPDASPLADPAATFVVREQSLVLTFRWVPLIALADTVLYPVFLRTALSAPGTALQHVVEVLPGSVVSGSAPPSP